MAIEFTPPLDDGTTTGPLFGWLRVFANKRIVPVVQAQVDMAVWKTMFSGGAGYIGFTAANSGKS
jgi:hypothetical protein